MEHTQTSAAEFENAVLAKISGMEFKRAEFFNGTLFVETDEKSARRIFSTLFMGVGDLPWGRVQVSHYGDEYAYDFVA